MNALFTRVSLIDVRIDIVFAIVLVCFLSCSCASEVDVLKPAGEQTIVTLSDSTRRDVELLAVSDSALCFVEGGRVGLVRLADVRNVYVRGYLLPASRRMLGAIPILLFEGLVVGLAFAEESEGWGFDLVTMIPVVLTQSAVAMEGDQPDVNFSPPFDKERLRKLRLYSRYPQGLTEDQWAKLLAFLGQTTFAPLVPR